LTPRAVLSFELDQVQKTARRGESSYGKLGPVYCTREDFIRANFCIAFTQRKGGTASKNDIFREALQDYYDKLYKQAEKKDCAEGLMVKAEEMEEERLAKKAEKDAEKNK